MALRGHVGDPDEIPFALGEQCVGQGGLKGRGDAFGDAHGHLDRPGRAAEKPGGEVGESSPLRQGILSLSVDFLMGAEGNGSAIAAMRGLRVYSFMALFALHQRLRLLQGGQPAESLGKVGRIRERKTIGHLPCFRWLRAGGALKVRELELLKALRNFQVEGFSPVIFARSGQTRKNWQPAWRMPDDQS